MGGQLLDAAHLHDHKHMQAAEYASPAYLDCVVNDRIEPVDINLWGPLWLWQGDCFAGCITTSMGNDAIPFEGRHLLGQRSSQGAGLDGWCRTHSRHLLNSAWPVAQDSCHTQRLASMTARNKPDTAMLPDAAGLRKSLS
jgi:hypothetical protein